MTITIVYADSNDGYVTAYGSTYTIAREGTGTFFASNAGVTLVAGQQHSTASGYGVTQAFVRFPYTVPTAERVSTAAIRVYVSSATGAALTARSLDFRSYVWVSPVDSADYRPGSTLGSLPLFASMGEAQRVSGQFVISGSAALLDAVNGAASGTVSVVAHSSRTYNGDAPRPDSEEQSYFSSADEAGTVNDPCLILSSERRSTLYGVRHGSVRLSDGTWAVLESDGAVAPTVTLRRHTGTAATTIATIGADFRAPAGPQAYSLAVDASDNLYVVGASSSGTTLLAAQAFVKGAGWAWTASAARTASLAPSSGRINLTACAWTASGGAGSLLVAGAYSAGESSAGMAEDVSYVVLSCSALLAGSGTASLTMGGASGSILPADSVAAGYFTAYTNEVGAALDVVATADRTAGYIASLGVGSVPGSVGPVGVGRWAVSSAGAVSGASALTAMKPTKDAVTRVRVVPTGGSTAAVVTVDPATGWGLTVVPYQVSGSTWTALATPIKLGGESISGMPSPSILSATPAWDALWSEPDNMLIVYFRDATDSRIIRRTRVNLSTYAAVRDSTTVATVGASGASTLGLRVAADRPAGASVLLSVASVASDATTLSTAYVLDPYNSPPTPPTLTPRANYDATSAATFAWTFNDPNTPTGDTQSAYQLQIVNTGTGSTVLDTGKVASATTSRSVAGGTLANDATYQWRVMTWDVSDAASPWSPYSTFSTSAGGSATITNPATDNPANAASSTVSVSWSVSDTTQAKYRLWATRNDTGATVGDTGWVTSSATTASVSGLVSGVEHTLRVQVESALAVRSAVGTRLITPTYTNPDAPLVAVSSETDGGYMLVAVTNPAPTGDRPAVASNEIYRRIVGDPDWTLLGSVGPSGAYRDYSAAAGVAYEYKVRGQA